IAIAHIDNPLSFEVFEDDASFISKTEEGLRTLHHFRQELTGYSNMLGIIDRLRPWGILSVIRLWHRLFGSFERQCLTTKKAPLWLFSLYRLGYYLNLKD
ncbi:MAG: glycosyltransferase family 2 protein, partial [Prevotella sp.]|nr:glycosyltransferase family 2 protein [Prevotella sp.]